jgi:hypothetical protein
MSSTKFKVKQVKSGSETGLETYVELPIDQEETARLMPSEGGVDIGSSTLNWGDAYLGNVECGTIATSADLTVNGDATITGELDVDNITSNVSIGVAAAQSVSVDIDSNNNGDTATFRLTANGGANNLVTVDEEGDVLVYGNVFVDGDKISRVDTDPLVLDATRLVVQNSLGTGVSTVTVRDSQSSRASLELIEGDGNFGSINNKGFRLTYDGVGSPERLLLKNGYGSASNEVFSVPLRGISTPSSDIEFFGLVSCEPSASTEGGVRTAYIGGASSSYNSVSFTTHDQSGHFTPSASDSGTFIVNGPSAAGGILRYITNDLDLRALGNVDVLSTVAGNITLDTEDGNILLNSSGTATMRSLGNGDVSLTSEGGDITLSCGGNGDISISAANGSVTTTVGHNNNVLVDLDHGNFDVSDENDTLRFSVFGTGGDIKFNLSDKEAAIDTANNYRVLAIDNQGYLKKSDHDSNDILVQAFTGTHIYESLVSLEVGQSVALVGNRLELTSSPAQSNCVGIVQRVRATSLEEPIKTSFSNIVTSGNVYYVAAVGDSIKGDLQGFNVCNEGGEILAGDLLVTSSVPGRLMKQADDIIRASTVGKAMQDVTFNDKGQADDVYGFIYCG